MTVIGFDAETHSDVNLTTAGADAYTRDPGTRCLMFAYKPIGAPERPRLWIEGEPPPDDFIAYLRDGAGLSGWNVVNFDRRIYDRVLVAKHGFPALRPEVWLDSMHRAAAANLPRSLDGCASAVGLGFKLDLKDTNRIRRVTNATKTPLPLPLRDILTHPGDTPARIMDDLRWLMDRCLQDVELEEGVLLRLPPWPDMDPWAHMPGIDRRINDRGILMDVELVRGLVRAATIETARLDEEIARLTDGGVPRTTNVEALKTWLIGHGVALPPNEPEKEEADDDPEDDEEKETPKSRKSPWRLRKTDIADLLARPDVPEHCRRALAIRSEAGKASVSKLRRMATVVAPDGHLYGTMTIGGAQQTLRWASQGVNLYNTVRDVYGNADEIAEMHGLDAKKDKDAVKRLAALSLRTAIVAGRTGDPELLRALYERQRRDAQGREYTEGVMTWISRMMRRTLSVPAGMAMLNGDFAQIEARITVWLAQQLDMLGAFARGEDVYRVAAGGIYKADPVSISKEQRQVGKVSILACGFGGGPNALVAMGYNYGLVMSFADAQPIVQGYREANQNTYNYWYATDDAAAAAVLHPGVEIPVPPLGIVSYFMRDDCLHCRLPSGRLLRYWQPRLSQEYWDEDKTQPKSRLSLSGIAIKGRSVFRRSLYHTILVENQVQSIGVELLAHALANAERNGIPVMLHVYDSMAAKVPEQDAERILPVFEQCMLDQPSWTKGLPIAADVDIGARFG